MSPARGPARTVSGFSAKPKTAVDFADRRIRIIFANSQCRHEPGAGSHKARDVPPKFVCVQMIDPYQCLFAAMR